MTDQDQVEPEMPSTDALREDSIYVHNDGRFHLPDGVIDYFGLSAGDVITVTLFTDGDEVTFQWTIDDELRVRVPKRIRDRFDIVEGGYADMAMEVP